MKVAITSLENDINFAKSYLEDNKVDKDMRELKLIQIADLEEAIEILKEANKYKWVTINSDDDLPKHDDNVLVLWNTGRVGINAYFTDISQWKYNFNKHEVVKWCNIKLPKV